MGMLMYLEKIISQLYYVCHKSHFGRPGIELGPPHHQACNQVAEPHSLHGVSFRKNIRGLLEKYPTFGREKETGLLGALDT